MRYEQMSDGNYEYSYDDDDYNYPDAVFTSSDDDDVNVDNMEYFNVILYLEYDGFSYDYLDDGPAIYSVYGNCFVADPRKFIPDGSVCMPDELISWRRALREVRQGTFASPKHYFWQTADGVPYDTESAAAVKGDSVHVVVHGHYKTWGMGLNSCSDEISVWEDNLGHDWLLKLALSDIPDNEFVSVIQRIYGVYEEIEQPIS